MNQLLVDHLLKHSVKRGEFTLRSGKQSNWFIDAKQTTCSPDGMLLVADAFLAVLPDDITAVGGLTMGADGITFSVAAIAATRGRMLRSFSVRKEDKDHGAGGRIAGSLQPGDRVALTDDAITRGVAFLEAAAAVRAAGAEPVIAIPVVDRGGTAAAMCGRRHRLHAAGDRRRPRLRLRGLRVQLWRDLEPVGRAEPFQTNESEVVQTPSRTIDRSGS